MGDRIEIGSLKGDVIDQGIFIFTIMEIGNWVEAEQSTGRMIHIPNGRIFHDHLANYTNGFEFIWSEIPILLTFESDWEKAESILSDIVTSHTKHLTNTARDQVKQASQKYLISYSKLTPTTYLSVTDSGVLLTLRYLCNPRQRRNIDQEIWRKVLKAFRLHPDIDFAYPTRRVFNNATEGKPGSEPSFIKNATKKVPEKIH